MIYVLPDTDGYGVESEWHEFLLGTILITLAVLCVLLFPFALIAYGTYRSIGRWF